MHSIPGGYGGTHPRRAMGRIPRRYRVHAPPRREIMEASWLKLARPRHDRGRLKIRNGARDAVQDRRDRRPQDFLSRGGQSWDAEAGTAAWVSGLVASVPLLDDGAVR